MLNAINSEEKKEEFIPTSGVTNRWLYKENVNRGEGEAVSQAIGRKDVPPPSNPNDYVYSRSIEFPQPSIIGIGAVTSGGAKDTSRFFFSQNWTTQRIGAGVYTITHNIGDSKYAVQVSPVAATAFTANISSFSNDSFNISTFNAVGAATNCAFTFIVYMIP